MTMSRSQRPMDSMTARCSGSQRTCIQNLRQAKFRAFLKSHTHPDPENADGAAPEMSPASSARRPGWREETAGARLSAGRRHGRRRLGRKKSMLSRQYHPRAGDRVGEEDNLLQALSGVLSEGRVVLLQ